MALSEITRRRLFNQQITHTNLQSPAEIVGWLGAIQGQDYPGAKWSVGLRLPGCTDAAVEQAINDKTLLRTWLMRGTLHLVAAADIRWLLALLAPRVTAGSARRYQELELDADTFRRGSAIIMQALEGGQHRTRAELVERLEQAGIATQAQRGIHLLQRVSLDGLICQGVMQRSQATFMALDDVPPAPVLAREDALAELARRYFTSRGPVTLQDFASWAGLPVSDARAGLEAVRAELVEETINGQTCWQPPIEPVTPPRLVYLLPGFDEYILGYRDRRAVLDPEFAQRICPGGNGVFYPTIISDGRVVGIWKRAIKKKAVEITFEPFTSLSGEEARAAAAAAQPFGDFLGLPVVLK